MLASSAADAHRDRDEQRDVGHAEQRPASCWDPMPTPAHTPIQAASAITISDQVAALAYPERASQQRQHCVDHGDERCRDQCAVAAVAQCPFRAAPPVRSRSAGRSGSRPQVGAVVPSGQVSWQRDRETRAAVQTNDSDQHRRPARDRGRRPPPPGRRVSAARPAECRRRASTRRPPRPEPAGQNSARTGSTGSSNQCAQRGGSSRAARVRRGHPAALRPSLFPTRRCGDSSSRRPQPRPARSVDA